MRIFTSNDGFNPENNLKLATKVLPVVSPESLEHRRHSVPGVDVSAPKITIPNQLKWLQLL